MFLKSSLPLSLAALLVLSLSTAACGDDDDNGDNGNNGDHSQVQSVASDDGHFEATFEPDPDPPVSGDNAVTLSLVDGDGDPVEGAELTVEPWMPGHGHGSPTEEDIEAHSTDDDGVYHIHNINYNMGGFWELHVDVSGDDLPDDRVTAEFDVQS